MVRPLLISFVALAIFIGACRPDLDDRVSLVSTARVLGVRSELVTGAGGTGTKPGAPAEAEVKIGEPVKLRALFVDRAGPADAAGLDWAFCGDRKPLAELGPVSPRCLAASGAWLTPLGTGAEVTGTIATNACEQFGSDAPSPKPGEPSGRRVDPDPTGGYDQPTRVLAPGPDGPLVTIAETRLQCTLASFSPDLVAAFQQRYHRNANPEIGAVGIKGAPAPWSADDGATGARNQVGAGQRLALEVSWPSCPLGDVEDDGVCGPDEVGTTCGTCGAAVTVSRGDCCVDVDCKHALGCAGAERYVRLDPTSGTLVDAREAMAVAWYATAGTFDVDRAGRRGDDLLTTSDNTWQAPDMPGPVTLWVVLRDDRGGIGWTQVRLEVR